KRRRTEKDMRGKPKKRVKNFKKQTDYHSSSEDEGEGADDSAAAVENKDDEDKSSEEPTEQEEAQSEDNDEASDAEAGASADNASDSEASSDNGNESEGSVTSSNPNLTRVKRKRNDPDAFATSMQKILGSKLTISKRADPILSRSKDADLANKELTDQRLDTKARHKMREEKKAALDRGRIKDVMGLNAVDVSTAEIVEQEKRLKKTAQRGVVKLFNAVRAAQVKGEEAARQARQQGVVGMQAREEKVNEMSKKGFLDLIAGGG
ncbi:Rrp15p-domain-containing protein, partial [Saccharata proteae CBS 121410]